MDDLEALAGELHERGMSLCIDLVLNHTAAEHAWARAAAAGDPAYRDFYLIYPDRTEPDAYERTLPEVFPDNAPGSFTDVPGVGVVWTTFNTFQWDLNWANPRVFEAMLGVLLDLANRGIDVLRLDAAPFLWKRLGTNCQNQPEAHLIVQALRALVRIAAPAVVFKAEAIVAPDDLVQYLGAHEHYRPECDLAYHNQLMVMLWSSIATRDARLATVALRRLRPAPPEAGWVTYVRCHDDIGWAVSDTDAWAVGWDPLRAPAVPGRVLRRPDAGQLRPGSRLPGEPRHRRRPYVGQHGRAVRARARDPVRRRRQPITAGVRRVLLLYALIYSFGGIPLVYMGDEIGLAGDPDWADAAGPGRRQPVDAPALDGLGSAPSAATTRSASRAGSSTASGRSAPSAVRSPRSGWAAARTCSTPPTRACWPSCAPIRAAMRSSSWPTSATRR